jgi:hypothetical protein
MEQEKVIDELLAGISDELTNEIESFFTNFIDGRDKQLKIVELLNKAYVEGNNKVTLPSIEGMNKIFMEEFNKKLLDGQDKPVS